MGFPEGEFKVTRFLGPQVRFRVGRSPVASQLRPRECVQRIQPGQAGLPTRTRRAFRRNGIPLHSSAAGYSACWVPPFASDPWAGTWRSGSPALLPRGESPRSGGAVEDRVRQRGNAVTHRYGKAKVNDSGQNSQPPIARWGALHRVRFIPALKGRAFSCCPRSARPSAPAGTRPARGINQLLCMGAPNCRTIQTR